MKDKPPPLKLAFSAPVPLSTKKNGGSKDASKKTDQRLEIHYLLINTQGLILLETPLADIGKLRVNEKFYEQPMFRGTTTELFSPNFTTGTERGMSDETLLAKIKRRIGVELNVSDIGAVKEIARVRMNSTQISIVTCRGSLTKKQSNRFVWLDPKLPTVQRGDDPIQFNIGDSFFVLSKKSRRIILKYAQYENNGQQRIVGRL